MKFILKPKGFYFSLAKCPSLPHMKETSSRTHDQDLNGLSVTRPYKTLTILKDTEPCRIENSHETSMEGSQTLPWRRN